MAAALQGADLQDVLAFLQYASTYPDFPKNFSVPSLSVKGYVPPDESRTLILAGLIPVAVTIVVVITRLVVRLKRKSAIFGLDDWLIVPGLVLTIGYTVAQVLISTIGCMGRHAYDCTLPEIKFSYQFQYVFIILSASAVFFVKSSILAFVRRLSYQSPVYRHLVTATWIFVLLTAVGCILTTTFVCKPFSAIWDVNVIMHGERNCDKADRILLAWAIVNAATDLWMVLLPSIIVWNMRMPKRTKTGIVIVFACALIATAAATFKAATVAHAYNTYDTSWSNVPVLIAGQLELCFGCIAASLPALNFGLVRILACLTSVIKQCGRCTSSKMRSKESVIPYYTTEDLEKPKHMVYHQEHPSRPEAAVTRIDLKFPWEDSKLRSRPDSLLRSIEQPSLNVESTAGLNRTNFSRPLDQHPRGMDTLN